MFLSQMATVEAWTFSKSFCFHIIAKQEQSPSTLPLMPPKLENLILSRPQRWQHAAQSTPDSRRREVYGKAIGQWTEIACT